MIDQGEHRIMRRDARPYPLLGMAPPQSCSLLPAYASGAKKGTMTSGSTPPIMSVSIWPRSSRRYSCGERGSGQDERQGGNGVSSSGHAQVGEEQKGAD